MTMRRNIVYLILFVSFGALSQQIPQYSQYLRNQFMVNPASAGVYDFLDITASGRWQWIGFGNEPRTAYLSGAGLLGKKEKVRYNPSFRVSQGPVKNPDVGTGKLKHAIGGQVLIDEYGAFRRSQIAATYAIHLPINEKMNMSFGTRLGMSNNSFLQDRAVVLNTKDPYADYDGGDAGYDDFVKNNSSVWIMDVGVGMYLYSKNLFVGVSADQLSKDLVQVGSSTANFNTQIHYNLTAGYKIPLDETMTIMPALLIKNMQPAPFSMEYSIQMEYLEWLWGGFSYRHKDAIVGFFGMNISQKFKFGYSYDFSLSRFRGLSSGGHELVLGYMIGR